MLLVYLIFTIIYWVRPKSVSIGHGTKGGRWGRFKAALNFSLHTSLKFSYGYNKATSVPFKVLAFLQAAEFKIMVLLLLTAVSHTSPLLNDLLGKLVPH